MLSLEMQGRVRKRPPVGWAVFVGGPREWSYSDILGMGDEILSDVTSTEAFQDVRKDGTVHEGLKRVTKEVWQPERMRRTLIRNVPEPLYDEGDVQKLAANDGFIILRSEKERDRWIIQRRAAAEEEGRIARAKQLEADRQFIEAREEEQRKLRGEPEAPK